MRADDRLTLRQTYDICCGYCGVTETDVGAELTIDHFQPTSRGGLNHQSNLVYACHPCNEFKGDYWNPEGANRILHPLRESLKDHLIETEDGLLEGRTPTGQFHIERLRLNRTLLVRHRLERRNLERERARLKELLERLGQLETKVQSLTAELQQVEPD